MKLFITTIVLVVSFFHSQIAYTEELINLKTKNGIAHQALLFQGDTHKAVVLAHQSGATMESWTQFANKLAARGITSISLNSITPDDVSAAVHYLKANHYNEIMLIGASLGGGAIMQTLAKEDLRCIKKVVLLSPSTGPAMTSDQIYKLVMVSKTDFYKSRSYATFEEALAPKVLREYEGTEHGQALLEGKHAENVHGEIFKFLNLEPSVN